MASNAVLEVERVEEISDTGAICIVRCLDGAVTLGDTGQLLTPDGETDVGTATMEVVGLWRYEQPVDLVDAPHVAKLQLAGHATKIERGYRLVIRVR